MPEETTAVNGQEPVTSGADETGAQVAPETATASPESPAPATAETVTGESSREAESTDQPLSAADLAQLKKDLAHAQKELDKVRKEAANNRVKGNQAEQALEALKVALAKSLGIETEETAKKPEDLITDLQNQLNETRSKYRQERLKSAFSKAADKAGVDEEIAFAVMTLAGDLDDLDIEDSALTAELQERMRTAAERNPRIKIVTAPKLEKTPEKAPAPSVPDKSGPEFKSSQEAPLTRAMIAQMTPDEINANWERISAALATGKIT